MFTPVLKLEIAAICVIHMVAIVLSVVCITVFYMKTRRDDHAANAFLVMQGAMIFWMVFKIFKTVAPEVDSRWVFILGYYACTCVLEIAFIEFGYAYDKGRPLPTKVRRILYIFPVMQFSWILTNPLHAQFYPRYDFWDDTFGPLFYLHMALEYSFIIAGFIFCRRRFKREFSGKSKVVVYIISLAIITPLFLNLLYITKVINHFTVIARIPIVFDITPIVFTWSTLLFMYATFNHDFLSPTPLMRHEITHHLNLPLALFNHRFRLVYANQACQELMARKEHWQTILDRLSLQARAGGSLGYEHTVDDRDYFIHCNALRRPTGRQYLVSIKNISAFKSIQADITAKVAATARENKALEETIDRLKNLSRQSARKFVARELHDIIGHSLVTAVKLLEVARIYHATAPDQSRSALTNASQVLKGGLSGIKAIPMATGPAPRTGEELKQTLLAMTDPLGEAGLEVTLKVEGIIYILDPDTFHALEQTCRELMTNCLKHARANRLFISLKIKESRITLLAVDNGIGIEDRTRKGSGLSGMEERIQALDGELRFSPAHRDGFMVRMQLPRTAPA